MSKEDNKVETDQTEILDEVYNTAKTQTSPTPTGLEKAAPQKPSLFWLTIYTLLGVTLIMYGAVFIKLYFSEENNHELTPGLQIGIGSSKVRTNSRSLDIEFEKTQIESWVAEIVKKQASHVIANMDTKVNKLFAPVYDNVKSYANFYYSIKGQYVQLGTVLLSDVAVDIAKRLYPDLEERMAEQLINLSEDFSADVEIAVFGKFLDEIASNLQRSNVSFNTQKLIEEVSGRLEENDFGGTVFRNALMTKSGLGLAVVGTKAGVKIGAKQGVKSGGAVFTKLTAKLIGKSTSNIASKIAIRTAAQAAAKGATKGASTALGAAGAGAGAGAALCSWTGPGAVACAAVGAVGGAAVAWVATDKLIVEVDEAFTRDEFEAELVAMIDQQKLAYKELIEGAFEQVGVYAEEDLFKLQDT